MATSFNRVKSLDFKQYHLYWLTIFNFNTLRADAGWPAAETANVMCG